MSKCFCKVIIKNIFLGEFGSFEWSPDETKLIYIAEKKNAKLEAYYKRKSKSDDNDDNKVSNLDDMEEKYKINNLFV